MRIYKKDENYIRIDCDRGTAKHLNDYFSFYASNYYFNPSYKAKRWDGKIRLFNLHTLQIYTGLFKRILSFAEKFEYEIQYIDPSLYPIPPSEEELTSFLKNFKAYSQSQNKFLDISDFQYETIKYCITDPRSLLLSPTSSGKSLMLYALTRWHHERVKGKILTIVPLTHLIGQMIDDFVDYSYKDDWDVKSLCHSIHGGQDKNTDKPIVFSTWQSIYKEPLSYFKQFEVLNVDEAHGATAASIKQIAEKVPHIGKRLGFTGTIEDTKSNKLVLEGIFGPIQRFVSTKNLMDMDFVSNLTINIIILEYDKDIKKQYFDLIQKDDKGNKRKAAAKFAAEINFLINHEQRNKFISKLCVLNKENTLVMFNRVKHGEKLYEMIHEIEGEKTTHFVAGKTHVDSRTVIRKRTFKEDNLNIIASSGVFSTGVNMPNLQYFIGAHPFKSEIKILQSLGRMLRKDGKKNHAQIYDIADDLRKIIPDKKNPSKTKVSWKNYSYRHLQERIRLYKKQNFDYKIIKIKI